MAIRKSRRQLGLTQKELAELIGLQGRAIGRWEWGQSGPTRRNRERLVRAVTGKDPVVGAALDAELARLFPFQKKRLTATAPAVPPPPPPPDAAALERALYVLADEHDVTAKRLRAIVLGALRGITAARFGLDDAIAHLEARGAAPPAPAPDLP